MSCISNYFIVLSKTPLDYQLLSYEYPSTTFVERIFPGLQTYFFVCLGWEVSGRYYKIKGEIIYLQFVVTSLLLSWLKLIITDIKMSAGHL